MSESNSLSADELRARMDHLRRKLRVDVARTSVAARRLTDWRYYVRHFPWASAAAAAALGFLIVPRREPRPVVDQEALENLMAEKRVVVIPQSEDASGKKGLASTVGAAVAAMAARTAMNYMSNKLVGSANGGAARQASEFSRVPK